MFRTEDLTAETEGAEAMSFLRWTKDRIPLENIAIKENTKPKTGRKAAKNAATEVTEKISY